MREEEKAIYSRRPKSGTILNNNKKLETLNVFVFLLKNKQKHRCPVRVTSRVSFLFQFRKIGEKLAEHKRQMSDLIV